MKPAAKDKIDILLARYPVFKDIADDITRAAETVITCYKNGGKLLVCGNGGSAADAEHIVGELMKGFVLKRPIDEKTANAIREVSPVHAGYLTGNLQGALPAIALVGHPALATAFANDNAPDLVFAQQVLGFGKKGDVLLAISTSGISKNCIYAAEVAKAKGLSALLLTGKSGGSQKGLFDVCIAVPEIETYKIQEMQLPVYHTLCLCLESEFFDK